MHFLFRCSPNPMIVAQRGGIGRREVIAEFPLEMHAEIFRDMCEGFVRSERLTK